MSLKSFRPLTLAITLFGVVSVSGSALGSFDQAEKAYSTGDLETAYREWHRAASEGDAMAQFLVGNMLAAGEGVEADMESANDFYLLAARQGHVEAQIYLATNYRLGQGVDQDYGEAAKWLYKAAEKAHPVAQMDLGDMFLYGDEEAGFRAQPYHALQWYRLAGQSGIRLAQFKVAQIYLNGGVVPRDEILGFAWLERVYQAGPEEQSEWSKRIFPFDGLIPDDEEGRTFRQVVEAYYAKQSVVLKPEAIKRGREIASSGDPSRF